MNSFIQKFGLHPLGALAFVCVDMMLFGADMTIVGWLISIPVGFLLFIACLLLQRFSYKDDWGTSVAKALIVGVLTAIPTPLPAIVTGMGGILGAIGAAKGLLMEPRPMKDALPPAAGRPMKDALPPIEDDPSKRLPR